MGYFDDFEAALQQAAKRKSQPTSRRPIVTVMFVVVIGVTVVGLLSTMSSQPARASTVAVRIEADSLLIRVVRADAEPSQIVEDLIDEGLNARTVAAPTGPSRVGQLTSLTAIGEDITSDTPKDIRVPVGWAGTIDVAEGVPARTGEQYVAPTNAFAHGEPLSCLSESDVSVGEVALGAELNDVVVEWRGDETNELLKNPAPRSRVETATATSASTIIVRVGAETTSVKPVPSACG